MIDFWNERYAQKDFAYGTLPNNFLKKEIKKLEAGKILFVCEGEGRNAVYAAKNNWHVDAFDLSLEAKKKANLLAAENNVTINYQIGDAATIEYPKNSFDVIALIFAHFPDEIRSIIHQKILHWLKPNGFILLEAFNQNQLNNLSGGPKQVTLLYTTEMLKNDFKKLDVQFLANVVTLLNEGKYHCGKADVIRLIAKKTI